MKKEISGNFLASFKSKNAEYINAEIYALEQKRLQS